MVPRVGLHGSEKRKYLSPRDSNSVLLPRSPTLRYATLTEICIKLFFDELNVYRTAKRYL